MNNKHFYFDGYSLDSDLLANENNIIGLANRINEYCFNNQGKLTVIPYFNGKIHDDGGISIVILGSDSHFTCHTFCYKNTVFIDYYGDSAKFDKVKEIILSYYPTDDFDLCINNQSEKGNFGKHIIYNHVKAITFDKGIELIKTILKDINMTPINDVICLKQDDYNFDLIQPIAESHISFHQKNNNLCIDVFSCKYFNEKILCDLLNNYNYEEINRGIRYDIKKIR